LKEKTYFRDYLNLENYFWNENLERLISDKLDKNWNTVSN